MAILVVVLCVGLCGRMIEEIVRSQALNKVLMATPPPIDPAEQLLPRSCPAVASSSSSVPATARASSPTTTPMTPPAPIATPPTTRCPFSLAAPHIPGIWSPGDMWVAPLQVAQFLAGLPQLQSASTADRLRLLTLIPAVGRLLLSLLQVHTFFISRHLISPMVISPSAIQQATICCCWFWMAILTEEWIGER